MSKKDTLESYYNTENEHWNRYAFQMVCDVIKQPEFENKDLPLELYKKAFEIIADYNEQPLQAVQLVIDEMDKSALSGKQKSFVLKWVLTYLEYSEFDYETRKIEELFKSHNKRLRAENEPQRPLIKCIRETLKTQVQKELENLPETLKDLDPEKRLNIVCKLIPYVLPKVEAVHSEKDEPDNWNL